MGESALLDPKLSSGLPVALKRVSATPHRSPAHRAPATMIRPSGSTSRSLAPYPCAIAASATHSKARIRVAGAGPRRDGRQTRDASERCRDRRARPTDRPRAASRWVALSSQRRRSRRSVHGVGRRSYPEHRERRRRVVGGDDGERRRVVVVAVERHERSRRQRIETREVEPRVCRRALLYASDHAMGTGADLARAVVTGVRQIRL